MTSAVDTFYLGAKLQGRKCAVLNSRQGRFYRENDRWIQASISAVRKVIKNGDILLTSIGLATYEIITYLASEYKGKQILVLPLRDNEAPYQIVDRISEDFNLDPSLCGFLFFHCKGSKQNRKDWWRLRDSLVLQQADVIYPISVRAEGNLQSELELSRDKIDSSFSIDYKPISRSVKLKLEHDKLKHFGSDWNYLTHWLKTSQGKWDCENSADYYHDVMRSGDEYARSAKVALMKILFEGTIYASSENYRGKTKAVSFSENSPAEMIDIMKYRSRFSRFNFEPYGIAIDKDYAKYYGFRKVIYGNEEMFSQMNDIDKPYFQPEGKQGLWREEREWRYLEDLDLSLFSSDKIKIIVPDELDFFKKFTSHDIICLNLKIIDL